ncbi:2-oxoglutarate dehydrogenase complex dihydrolipoyllysine-residue succinyltransferase [Thiorhodospira sibirica]|uniref:2-oxoglutarate dehydrogenase complex dihydrolipoyllysine-residue succinyltransferase n=1 Tax=Thiorhodospira sibirica TaxID=154347 RepID=UPI00022C0562|nr:2-oxoglutarate dehydrogenase complex dihydrolipoyllysine-residue succinyltransferase [Thiorhodospira sibirica]
MSIEIKIPPLPESVSDATIVSWHKRAGDAIAQDHILVDIETDKVVLEIPAPASGTLERIIEAEGSVVTAGQVIGTLRPAEAKATETAPAPQQTPPPVAAQAAPVASDAPALSPAVRKLVATHELDPDTIEGSGRDGRILKEDVLRHLQQQPSEKSPGAAPAVTETTQATTPPSPPVTDNLARPERRVPMTRLRARIAERLVEVQRNAAILTTFNDVNMQPVMELRSRYRDSFEQRHGVRLGFMSFFVKAATEALKRFPEVNASIDGKDIVYHGYFDIGIAVSSPRGLVVPVLRDTDHLTMAEIERAVTDFGQRANKGELALDELSGGTFTISNGGIFGSLLSTPIINPPQSAILGMHRIQERPIAENGQVVIRPMMYLALSYDHRIIDGREAVQFLSAIKQMLEDPARLLLEV